MRQPAPGRYEIRHKCCYYSSFFIAAISICIGIFAFIVFGFFAFVEGSFIVQIITFAIAFLSVICCLISLCMYKFSVRYPDLFEGV